MMSRLQSLKPARLLDQGLPPAREKLSEAKDRAAQLARASRDGSVAGGRAVAAHVQKRPISSGLLVLGAVAGGALLLSPALRRLALANAPVLWRAARKQLEPVRDQFAKVPFPKTELVSRRAG